MTEYGRQSLWRDTAGLDATSRELAGRLELRAKSQDEIEARAAYLDLLGVKAGERVLDIGCGSGVVTRDIARRVGPAGRAVGIDPSPQFLVVARELAQAAGSATAWNSARAARSTFPSPTAPSTSRSPSRCSRTLPAAKMPLPRWRAWCARAGASESSTSTPT